MMSASNWDPETLLHDARQGDAERLGRLLDGYRNYLAMLARCRIPRRLSGKVDASDLVQETFLEACRAFNAFQGRTEAELTAWLRRILASRLAAASRRFFLAQARDVRLEYRLNKALEHSSFGAGHLALPQTTPSGCFARRERAVLLANALAELGEDYREVIILRNMEGLPFRDVARRMGRSESSVSHLWVRALAALNDALAETLGGRDDEPPRRTS